MKLIMLLSACIALGASGTLAQVYNSFINCVRPSGTPNGNINTGAAASSSDACIVSHRVPRAVNKLVKSMDVIAIRDAAPGRHVSSGPSGTKLTPL